MRRRGSAAITATALLALATGAGADDRPLHLVGDNFTVFAPTLTGAAAELANTGSGVVNTVQVSLGQSVAGPTIESDSFRLESGYWRLVPVPEPDPAAAGLAAMAAVAGLSRRSKRGV